MSGYHVDVKSAPDGHAIPPLLAALGEFVATQEHGALGWFDSFAFERIDWDEENTERLRRAGFAFLTLPEGSVLALLDTGVADAPRAVVLVTCHTSPRSASNRRSETCRSASTGR